MTGYKDENNFTRFALGIDDVAECPAIDLVSVVDISGSMQGTAAGETDGSTQYIEAGFSLLDLVKHSLKTIVNVLRPQDRMALILFND